MPDYWDVQGVPTFALKVNGTRVESDYARLIEQVTYRSSHDTADSIGLTIKDPTLRLVDAKVFAEGNILDLWMGYGHQNFYMGRGIIWEPPQGAAPEGGDATIRITAHSAARWMMEQGQKKGGRRFGGYRDRRHDKEIVEALAWDYGFKAQAAATEQKRKAFKAKGKSDWEFVRRMAFLDGFRVWVEWIPEGWIVNNTEVSSGQWNLCFLPPGQQPKRPRFMRPKEYEFVWGPNISQRDNRLLDYSWSFAAGAGASEVEVLRFDRRTYNYAKYIAQLNETGKPTTFHGPDATVLDTEKITTGSRVLFTTFGRQVHVIRDKPFQNEKEALEFAKSYLARIATSFIHLQGRAPGLPDVRKYTHHTFRGLPNRIAGQYEFMDVEHTMSRTGGYTMRFSGRRAPEDTLGMSAFRV